MGEIQRSLLPAVLPKIPTLDLASHYQPSQRAGGGYYDFFPLPGGKLGIFIADVSGHGTPAAVLMAVTHCIAHTHPGPPQPPATVLDYLNHHLAALYTNQNDNFITAFYGVYEPRDRTLTSAACAGQLQPAPPQTLSRRDFVAAQPRADGLPLGIAHPRGRMTSACSNFSPATRSSFIRTASPKPAIRKESYSAPTASITSWKTARSRPRLCLTPSSSRSRSSPMAIRQIDDRTLIVAQAFREKES